jgi:acyl-CoA thioesterase
MSYNQTSDVEVDKIKQYFEANDRLGKHLGINVLEIGKGFAKVKMEIMDIHLNGVGTVHGGTIFTLADIAFAAASNSHGTVAVAINVNISFLKAISKGVLYAEAKEVSLNPKLGNYDVRVTNEENDLIAVFQGLAYRKKEKLLEIVHD